MPATTAGTKPTQTRQQHSNSTSRVGILRMKMSASVGVCSSVACVRGVITTESFGVATVRFKSVTGAAEGGGDSGATGTANGSWVVRGASYG